jgi:hypothetical protein
VAACSIQACSAEPSLDTGRWDSFRPAAGPTENMSSTKLASRGENMASSDLTRRTASASSRPEIGFVT